MLFSACMGLTMENDSKHRAVEPGRLAMRILSGRWKLPIVLILHRHQKLRFTELLRQVTGIRRGMLADQLIKLVRDGIIRKSVFIQALPTAQIEYSLTPLGAKLACAAESLAIWELEHQQELLVARRPEAPVALDSNR